MNIKEEFPPLTIKELTENILDAYELIEDYEREKEGSTWTKDAKEYLMAAIGVLSMVKEKTHEEDPIAIHEKL